MSFLDILIPPRCICMKPVTRNFSLCAECWKMMSFIVYTCECCGAPRESIPQKECQDCHLVVHGRSVVWYQGLSSKIVSHFKYYKRYMYGTLMAHYMEPLTRQMEFDEIVAIPLSQRRLLWRGYHHTAILAQALSRLTGKPMLTNCLKKIHGKRQVECRDREERLDNIKESFFVLPHQEHRIKDKKFLIVDDVLTTGSTIYECGKILRHFGAKDITFVTFARAGGPPLQEGIY